MTKKDVAELIRMNFALYKLGAKPLTDAELKSMSDVWLWHFEKYPALLIRQAFLQANAVCKFAIQPSDIFDQLKQMAAENMPAAESKWQQLKDAVRKAEKYTSWRTCPRVVGVDERGRAIKDDGTKALQELFDGLPGSIRAYLGGSSALVDLTRCTDTEMDTYRRNEFLQYVKANNTPDISALAELPQYGGRERRCVACITPSTTPTRQPAPPSDASAERNDT